MCCGRSVVQKHSSSGGESSGWVVKYPDGNTQVKTTEISARLAAALVPGRHSHQAGIEQPPS